MIDERNLMAIQNEELLHSMVRVSMLMRHIDEDETKGHGHHHPHHHGHHHGHGACCEGHGAEGGEASRCNTEADVEMSECGHGHGYGHGNGHGDGHGHGHGRKCHHRGQNRVLTMVSMQEGISQKDLAFLLGIRPQTLGEMLRKLEERELVERRKSEADGRVVEVSLTEAGRTRAAEIAERRKIVAADMFAVLSEEEKGQLAAILDKLSAEFEKRFPNPHESHKNPGSAEAAV